MPHLAEFYSIWIKARAEHKSSVCASGLTCLATNTMGTKAHSQSTGLRRISLSKGFIGYDLSSHGRGILPLSPSVLSVLLSRSSAGGRSFCSIAGCRSECLHANRRDEAGKHDTGKANHHRKEPRHNMSRRQIAVTDGETGYKSKIKSVLDAPLLYVPDEKSGPDHREKNPGQHRPDDAKQSKELYEEDAPVVP